MRARPRHALLLLVVAGVFLVAVAGHGRTAPPPPSVAVRVAPTGNDAGCARGASAAPCASFARAYTVARGGDVVEIAGGAYPAQSIRPAGDKSAAVTLRPAKGAVVTVDHLSIAASHVHVLDVIASGAGEDRGALDICDRECVPALQDVLVQNFRGKSAFIRASNVVVRGGEFGGFDACLEQNPEDAFRLWGGSEVPQPENVVVTGVVIHDVGSGAGNTCQGTPHAGYHVDCVQTQGGVNITFRGNVFYDCPTSNIQAMPFTGAEERNWLIENNVFGQTACCNSIVLSQETPGGDCSTFVVRYNLLTEPVNDVNCGGGALQLYGNVFTRNVSSCAGDSAESYNVYPARNSATCVGPGNRKCSPALAGAGGAVPAFRLLPTDRCARGAGDPKRYPAVDIAQHKRPQGTLPDAGPYELPVVKPKPKVRPKPKHRNP
jgi:hypothetical protein